MSVLQKIFTPGSLTKKKNPLQASDLDDAERQSRGSPKTSASTRIKRRSSAEDDDEDSGPLMRSVSLTVNCDPVPTSFKTNASFSSSLRAAGGPASPKSLRLSNSVAAGSGGSTHLDHHHQHNATLASSLNRHSQRSMFDKTQNNSSFAPGDKTVLCTSGAGNATGVNLWRLPWTKQQVKMCPNCHRPRQRDRTAYVSRGDYTVPQAQADTGAGDDLSEASDDMSYDDSEGAGGAASESVTYCRCGAAAAGGEASGAAEEHPPVFVIETQCSLTVQLPGTIAKDSDSDGEHEGPQRSYTLSLVSPLTSASLRRREPHVQPMLSAASRQTSSASVPKSVSTWLNDQQTSEAPCSTRPKAAK